MQLQPGTLTVKIRTAGEELTGVNVDFKTADGTDPVHTATAYLIAALAAEIGIACKRKGITKLNEAGTEEIMVPILRGLIEAADAAVERGCEVPTGVDEDMG